MSYKQDITRGLALQQEIHAADKAYRVEVARQAAASWHSIEVAFAQEADAKRPFYCKAAESFGRLAQTSISLSTDYATESMAEYAVNTARVAAHFGILALGGE